MQRVIETKNGRNSKENSRPRGKNRALDKLEVSQ
jgi:hypothetical protein